MGWRYSTMHWKELAFFVKYREHFLNASSNRDGVNSSFDKGGYWEYSSYLTSASKHTRITSSIREIINHTNETICQAFRPLMQGMKKSYRTH